MAKSKNHTIHLLPQPTIRTPSYTPSLPHHADWLGCGWQQDAEETSRILAKLKTDWLVVDHYGIDYRWEEELKVNHQYLIVIDDLADRKHSCDFLLEQNIGREASDYRCLVPNHCRLLIGPRYALLRPEFARIRLAHPERLVRRELRRILITMGGVDSRNLTCEALAGIQQSALTPDTHVTVVMGTGAIHADEIRKQSEQMPQTVRVLFGISNMADEMIHADLAIGAAGSTSWERCCLGLPALLTSQAANQDRILANLTAIGAADRFVAASDLGSSLNELSTHAERLAQMSQSAGALCDGLGVSRVYGQLQAHVA